MRLPHIIGDAGVTDEVRRLRDRFHYPDELGGSDDAAISIAGGGGTITLVVAASDALQSSKDRADFVCDGVADEVEINAAVLLLNTVPGGRILLSEGQFEIADNIDLQASTSLIGMNQAETILKFDAGTGGNNEAITVLGNATLRDMQIQWVTAASNYNVIVGLASVSHLDNVIFASIGAGWNNATLANGATEVVNCSGLGIRWFNNVSINGGAADTGFSLSGNTYFSNVKVAQCSGIAVDIVSGEHFLTNVFIDDVGTLDDLTTGGIQVGGNGALVASDISMTLAKGFGMHLTGPSRVSNVHMQSDTGATSGRGVYIDTSPVADEMALNNFVIDNWEESVYVDASDGAVLTGTYIKTTSGEGIIINDSDLVLISGGMIRGVGTTNTLDAVRLAGTCDRNIITGLVVEGQDAGGAKFRYGINVSAAGVSNTRIYENDMGVAGDYGTAVFNDAGTGTLWGPETDRWNLGEQSARTTDRFVKWDGTDFVLDLASADSHTHTKLVDDESDDRWVIEANGDITGLKDDGVTPFFLWDQSDDRAEFNTAVTITDAGKALELFGSDTTLLVAFRHDGVNTSAQLGHNTSSSDDFILLTTRGDLTILAQDAEDNTGAVLLLQADNSVGSVKNRYKIDGASGDQSFFADDGSVTLLYDESDSRWEAAVDFQFNARLDINNGIALGGGAAPTLGTIGGSGPTAAAQAQWVEIDIGGTAHWIPVWT